MRRKIFHSLTFIFGWGFILIGVVGLFLPPFPAILVLCVGFLLVSKKSARMRWLIMKLGRRYPKFRTALIAAKTKMCDWRERLRRAFGALRS
jgi:uncharacterized membrane protein YbaN (DUF454 family)